MLVERPNDIGSEVRRKLDGALKRIVPGLREHHLKAEEARIKLDTVYSQLGGETGRNVTSEQVRSVLQAELDVLQTSFLHDPNPSYADADWFKKALKFHTVGGLNNASLFMYNRADHWREVAHNRRTAEADRDSVGESERRVVACEVASKLMDSISLDLWRAFR